MKAKEPPVKAPVRTRTVGPGMPRCLRADALDDDAEAFLRLFNLLVPRSGTSFEIAGLRRRWRLMATALGRGAPVAATRSLVVAGPAGPIEARLIVPEGGGEPRPALLYRRRVGRGEIDLLTVVVAKPEKGRPHFQALGARRNAPNTTRAGARRR